MPASMFYDPSGAGLYDYLRRLTAPAGAGVGGGLPTPMTGGGGVGSGAPSSPFAIDTPPGAPVVIPGDTKEALARRRTTPSIYDWIPDPVAPSPPPASHIRYSTPTSGGFQDYNPERGIEAFAGGNFMGAEGTPGGGGYSPSQQDWSKVANPMGFDAYMDPIREAERSALLTRATRSAADPLWEEREKARIWQDTQVGINRGIQQSIMEDMRARLADIDAAIEREMPNATPEQKDLERQKRLARLEDEYATIFGNRGAASSVRSYSGSPLD